MKQRPTAFKTKRRLTQGWVLLDVLWASAVILLLSAAATLATVHVWQAQVQQQRWLEAHWIAQRWVHQLGRLWQQSGSLAIYPSGQGQVNWTLADSTPASPDTAFGAPKLAIAYATPEGFSHAGCLDFLATTLGDQVNDQVTLRNGSLRCTSHGVTQPLLAELLSWQLSWAVQVGKGWQWQTSPPSDEQVVQALEICLVQWHPTWPRSHRSARQDCAGQALASAPGETVLIRQVFHNPVVRLTRALVE